MERHFRHLEPYYIQKQELLLTYPYVLTLEEVKNLNSITSWIADAKLDCRWHAFLFRNLNFVLGYDFFFREGSIATLFKLTWGGQIDVDLPPLTSGFFLGEFSYEDL